MEKSELFKISLKTMTEKSFFFRNYKYIWNINIKNYDRAIGVLMHGDASFAG